MLCIPRDGFLWCTSFTKADIGQFGSTECQGSMKTSTTELTEAGSVKLIGWNPQHPPASCLNTLGDMIWCWSQHSNFFFNYITSILIAFCSFFTQKYTVLECEGKLEHIGATLAVHAASNWMSLWVTFSRWCPSSAQATILPFKTSMSFTMETCLVEEFTSEVSAYKRISFAKSVVTGKMFGWLQDDIRPRFHPWVHPQIPRSTLSYNFKDPYSRLGIPKFAAIWLTMISHRHVTVWWVKPIHLHRKVVVSSAVSAFSICWIAL